MISKPESLSSKGQMLVPTSTIEVIAFIAFFLTTWEPFVQIKSPAISSFHVEYSSIFSSNFWWNQLNRDLLVLFFTSIHEAARKNKFCIGNPWDFWRVLQCEQKGFHPRTFVHFQFQRRWTPHQRESRLWLLHNGFPILAADRVDFLFRLVPCDGCGISPALGSGLHLLKFLCLQFQRRSLISQCRHCIPFLFTFEVCEGLKASIPSSQSIFLPFKYIKKA